MRREGPPKQHIVRPPARYDNVPSHYGLADMVHQRKLNKEQRDQNGYNTTYKIR